MSDNHYTIKDMYDSLKEEEEGLEVKIRSNLLRISEIDEYLDSLYKKEDEDYKVFSPWNVEHIHRESIENNKAEKYKLENDNKQLYSRLNRVRSFLHVLEDEVINNNLSANSINIKNESNLNVLDMQECERQRIARDLHDTSLQNLAHLVHKTELVSMYIDKDPLQAKLELATVNKNLKVIIEEIRNTIFDLRPMSFDDLGLKDSFDRLFYKLKEMNSSIEFDIHIEEIASDNSLVLLNIFRVVQEASVNAINHSKATKLYVDIKQKENNCEIIVEDNGCGFSEQEVDKKHFGLSIMKERIRLLGGKVIIDSVHGKGTNIIISIPL